VEQRNTLLTLLSPFRIANVPLRIRVIGELVVSAVEFLPEGSDAIGYRVRFADPTRNGERKTVAWVVKQGGQYQILSLAGGQGPVGGEALVLAQKGDLAGARRWLNWEREEIGVPSSADPLAAEPFLKLWPPRAGIPERDRILAAAASLVARGHYYRQGVDTLSAIRAATQDRAFQNDIDFALADGLSRNLQYAEAVPVWRRVQRRYPDSEVAFSALGLALARSGDPDEALALAASAKSDGDLYVAALRMRARVFQLQHKYREAAQTCQLACKSSKATAVDWNDEAWLTLFLPGELQPDMDAANTANRLTQGRNTSDVHTLASVQAEAGQLKEARQSLVRYLSFYDAWAAINEPARYLIGRIAEGVGLRETAEQFYSTVAKPRIESGDDVYDLAQIRLKVIGR
jgi:tetratricopeptide (TPR) repeat protein